ncbi:glycoside hydrolase/deacetylase [Piromyces finnis]|uniref:Glycoside hydrolase/deacetylase n=1 Tax=Piromyces finnis TaxID=1754191 RepID=A0A1Y1VN15_9FUNG|nr:glycoside hydrolase/deacetylase [Piromyces finnis]|eukprot:ORX60789.1 glycoside hydrolase/deacetylase [Piromyces finnis]
MRYIKYILAAIALISSASAANEGKCGPGFGSCSSGQCCSQYGYCGTTNDHCGTGCKPDFGLCLSTKKTTTKTVNKKTTTKAAVTKKTTTTKAAVTKKTTTKKTTTKKTTTKAAVTKKTTTTKAVVTKKTTTTKAAITKKTTTVKPVTTTVAPVETKLPVSTTGMCGPDDGICPGTSCCSQYGFCGVSDAHCGKGCQSEFGRCGITETKTTTIIKKTTTIKNSSTTTAANTDKISTNGRCGAEDGSCPAGQCCSQYGYCGSTEDHCGTGCQSEFGYCGEIETVSGFKYYSKCIAKNQWALTFDDGPYEYDIKLLDLLKAKGVKATFFINGNNVMDIRTEKAKKIIQRMNKDGHIIASHTWSHANIEEISKKDLIIEMTNLEKYISEYTGKKPAFMRPPYGAGNGKLDIAKTLKSLGYTAACMWNVDTLDWEKSGNVDYALGEFKKNLGKPILSLNHNYYEDITEERLLKLVEAEIDYMISNGYTPVTMDECLGLEAYQ